MPSSLDNQTIGVIAAVVVLVGSVLYLNMGSGSSAIKPSNNGAKAAGKKDIKEKADESVSILHHPQI